MNREKITPTDNIRSARARAEAEPADTQIQIQILGNSLAISVLHCDAICRAGVRVCVCTIEEIIIYQRSRRSEREFKVRALSQIVSDAHELPLLLLLPAAISSAQRVNFWKTNHKTELHKRECIL